MKAPAEATASARALDEAPIVALQRTIGNRAVARLVQGGEPLDAHTRQRMETAFGTSFADVRTHSGPEGTRMAREHGATALALGSDVAFDEGTYEPGTLIGDALLAHELAHVVQQRDSEPVVQKASAGVAADSALEADADRSALNAVSGLWGGIRENARPRLKSGVRPQLKWCGASRPLRCPEGSTPGNTLSDDITVNIDESERRARGGSLELEGTVDGVDSGAAEVYLVETAGASCNPVNAHPEPIWCTPVRNGKFSFNISGMPTFTPGVGKEVLVKAGDGTYYNYECATVEAD